MKIFSRQMHTRHWSHNILLGIANQTHLLPPANEVCEGYIFTGVCLSTGGVSAPLHAGIHSLPCPPGPNTPLRSRYSPEQTPTSEQTPLRAVHAGRYGQQEGGTHPTGMYSCVFRYFINKYISFTM